MTEPNEKVRADAGSTRGHRLTITLISAVVVVGLLLAVVSRTGARRSPPRTAATTSWVGGAGGPSADATPVATHAPPIPAPGRMPAVRQEATAGGQPPAAIAVSVVDAEDRPLPGATVRARPAVPALHRTPSGATGTTDDHGRCQLIVDAWQRYSLRIARPGFASKQIVAGPGELLVRLDSPGGLHVRTFDSASGDAVGGAAVDVVATDTGSTRSESTDRSGLLRLDDVAPGSYDVRVSAPGYLAYTFYGVDVPHSPDAARLDLPLGRGLALEGRVVDAGSGAPVAVGDVAVVQAGRVLGEGGLDARGSFSISGLPTTRAMLQVRSPGYDPTPAYAEVEAAGELVTGVATDRVLVEAKPVPVITGRVLSGDAPVPGATVLARRAGLLLKLAGLDAVPLECSGVAFARTDESGRFRIGIPGLGLASPDERFEILAACPGFAPGFSEVHGAHADRELEIRLARECALQVRVLAAGGPAAGALITPVLGVPDARRSADRHLLRFVDRDVVADGEGRAVIGGLWPGRWRIEARSSDGGRCGEVAVDLESGQRSEAVVHLGSTGVYAGIVVDRAGTPIAGARVSSTDAGGPAATADAGGSFRLLLPGAPSTALLVSGGRVVGGQRIEVPASAGLRLEVDAVERIHRIHGVVEDAESGRPVPLATMKSSLTRGGTQAMKVTEFPVPGGHFQLEVAWPATGHVVLEADGYRTREVPIETLIAMAEPVRISLTAEPRTGSGRHAVTVVVPRWAGAPRVIALDPHTKEVICAGRAQSASEWLLRLDTSDPFLLLVLSFGGWMPRPVECDPLISNRVEIHLERGGGSAVVTTGPDDPSTPALLSPDGVRIELTREGPKTFSSPQLAPGVYTLTAGGAATSIEIKVGCVARIGAGS